MADDALFIGWGEVVRGREHQAIEVFGEHRWRSGSEAQDAAPGRRASSRACCQPHGGARWRASCWCTAQRAQLDALAARPGVRARDGACRHDRRGARRRARVLRRVARAADGPLPRGLVGARVPAYSRNRPPGRRGRLGGGRSAAYASDRGGLAARCGARPQLDGRALERAQPHVLPRQALLAGAPASP